ncbi:MAG: EAL domain-containing protein [Pseudomonadota bacterium]|nr:EAL domain-containing protein [Pseudomonadota bacterium]
MQPICSLHDDAGLAHYEVLLRLRAADGSLVQPAEFFARAAQQRLMPNIDRFVVRTLLVWLTNNRKLWTRVPSVFSINLSAQSITRSIETRFHHTRTRSSGARKSSCPGLT